MPLDANTTALVTGFGSQIRESVSNTVLSGTGFSTFQDTPFSITESCILATTSSSTGLTLPTNTVSTFGTGNFTIEWFQKADSTSVTFGNDWNIFNYSGSGTKSISIIIHASAWKVKFQTPNIGTGYTPSSIYGYGKSSGYVHIAAVKDGGYFKIYINGVLAVTSASQDVNNYTETISPMILWNGSTKHASLRVSNIARYTANFTPPSVNFDAYRSISQSLITNLIVSFSNTQYKNKNINQTGSLSLTVDTTAAKNKFNTNGLIDGAGSINGTVTNKGVGVSTTVRLYSTQGPGSLLATTTSDASGNFSFSTLVVGVNYFVVATHGTFANRSGKIVTAA